MQLFQGPAVKEPPEPQPLKPGVLRPVAGRCRHQSRPRVVHLAAQLVPRPVTPRPAGTMCQGRKGKRSNTRTGGEAGNEVLLLPAEAGNLPEEVAERRPGLS